MTDDPDNHANNNNPFSIPIILVVTNVAPIVAMTVVAVADYFMFTITTFTKKTKQQQSRDLGNKSSSEVAHNF